MLRYLSNGCLTIDIQRLSEKRVINNILSGHQPEARDYRMYLVACPNNVSGNSSSVMKTTTRQMLNDVDEFGGGFHSALLHVQPGEVILMLMLVVVWGCAVAYFLYKWRTMRIIQPSETRSKPYCPKNLETIKVVARHRDSVIYKSYSENMSRTMQARQKRLDRMNTMPNIKLGEPISAVSPVLRTKSLDAAAAAAAAAAGSPRQHLGQSSLSQLLTVDGGAAAGVSTFIDLANSCSSIMTSIQMGVIAAPIPEVDEECEAQTEC